MLREDCIPRWARKEEGFTLIEVAIALLILVLGIVGVAKMQSEAIKGSSFSMEMTDGINLAQDEVEFLKSLSSSSTSFGIGTHVTSPISSSLGRSYNISWTVSQISTGILKVDVTSTWQERGNTHSVTISFIK